MSVLVECRCQKKQSPKNKICSCGENLDKFEKSDKVKFWIAYRLPGNKQKFEKMKGEEAESITYAKAVESKRIVQKKENRIFDIQPEANMTFKELSG